MISTRSTPILQTLLALLLLVVQLQFLLHQLEFEAHQDEPACELCLQANLLGYAAINSNVHGDACPAVDHSIVADARLEIPASPRYHLPLSRAPPLTLV